jgi:hypothetical protein
LVEDLGFRVYGSLFRGKGERLRMNVLGFEDSG